MSRHFLGILGFLMVVVTAASGDAGGAAAPGDAGVTAGPGEVVVTAAPSGTGGAAQSAVDRAGAGGSPPASSHLDSVIGGLPERIEAWVERTRRASVAIAIVHDRDIVYSGVFGFADLEKKIAATPETIYPLASVTKVFTATMLAQLFENGVVDLETPVEKYVPEYEVKSPFPGTPPTTLRQLASHTSGLPEDAPNNFWYAYSAFGWIVTGGQGDLGQFVSKDEILSSLEYIALEYPPDIYSHYSNLGFQLLGMALEKAAGVPFDQYIQIHILEPLEMNNSGFSFDDADRPRMTVGYICAGPQAPLLPTPRWKPGCAVYSGGLYSTAEDMARFVALQFQEEHDGGDRILSTATLRRMRAPNSVRRVGLYDSYGLGWGVVRIADFDAIEHNGALLGHSAHVSAIPDLKLGMVVLSNSRNYMWSSDECKHLAREIYPDLIAAIRDSKSDVSVDPRTVDLTRYEGSFALPGGYARMELAAAEGKLFMSIVEDPNLNEPMVPINPYEFCFEQDPARTPILLFQTNDRGDIETASFLGYVFRRKAQDTSK